MEIIFTIKIDKDTEISLSEEQAESLYIKLEELFNKKKISLPTYPYNPVNPYVKYRTYTSNKCKIDDETRVLPIKINKPRKVNWSYYGNCTNSINE